MYPQHPERGIVKAAALALLAVLALPPAAVPSLDRDMLVERPALERGHHAGVCVPRHDHTLCTAFGFHRFVGSARPVLTVPETQRAAGCFSSQGAPPASSRGSVLRARAPPLG